MKKVLATLLAGVLAASMLVGCGGGKTEETKAASNEAASSEGGSVYFLNFKPEQDEAWQNLAKVYTEETGVEVTVVTAASGNYETTLMAEMGKEDAPTLFQVNGPVGLANWKDYCLDLADSDIYGEIISDEYVLKDGDAVLGIAYLIESYGLIANLNLLAEAGYTVEDIQSFEQLKAVAEDITARKDELGFAAFSSVFRGSENILPKPILFYLRLLSLSTTPVATPAEDILRHFI